MLGESKTTEQREGDVAIQTSSYGAYLLVIELLCRASCFSICLGHYVALRKDLCEWYLR
ncbi:hypothetical protein BDV39DRAFT_179876 [Aspergillus sergii]|uniref:Uncharacterized protein n=1 Tax=Aspergillus sergii TaxID=1034303 RepID=A0A5N6WW06_9EURO|nr:hypothetical protein BDV39DRAFT_179876 [Aspergillus sergii]